MYKQVCQLTCRNVVGKWASGLVTPDRLSIHAGEAAESDSRYYTKND